MSGEGLAELFHETYERLAPDFGYRTREASAVPWADVPEANKALMVAVATEVLAALAADAPADEVEAGREGCCDDWPQPCTFHEGFAAGLAARPVPAPAHEVEREPGCAFCDIVAGEAPATILREWDDALCIVPLNPVVPGHRMVIPKTHVQTMFSDVEVAAAVMRRAAECLHGVERHHDPYDCNVITSAGRDATQTVMHFHVHLVPRQHGDGLALPWTDQPARPAPAAPAEPEATEGVRVHPLITPALLATAQDLSQTTGMSLQRCLVDLARATAELDDLSPRPAPVSATPIECPVCHATNAFAHAEDRMYAEISRRNLAAATTDPPVSATPTERPS